MAPSIQDIRKAATKRRLAQGDKAPSRKMRRGQAESSARNEVGEREPRTSPAPSSPIDLTESPDKLGVPPPPLVPETESAPVGAPGPDPACDPAPSGVIPLASVERSAEDAPSAPTIQPESPTPAEVEVSGAAEGIEDAPPAPAAQPGSPAPSETERSGAPSLQSILHNHGRWAERVMAQAVIPEVQEFLRNQGTSAFFREASTAHFWAFNSLFVVRGLLSQAEANINQLTDATRRAETLASETLARAEEAEAAHLREVTRAEKAEAALEMALKAEAAAKEARSSDLARAERAEEALERAQRRAAHELDNAQVAEEKQRVAEENLRAAATENFVLQNRLHSATIEIKAAEERAENTEEIARRADTRIAELEASISRAEQEAVEAVRNFKESEAYNQELAATTAFAYDGGFQDCKDKVLRLYHIEGLEELEPDDIPEDAPSPPPILDVFFIPIVKVRLNSAIL